MSSGVIDEWIHCRFAWLRARLLRGCGIGMSWRSTTTAKRPPLMVPPRLLAEPLRSAVLRGLLPTRPQARTAQCPLDTARFAGQNLPRDHCQVRESQ
jgi:hypothetical protein